MNFFPDFEGLQKDRRIKFLDVNSNLLIYNAKDSYMLKVDELPTEFSDQIIKTVFPPVKTLIMHTTYECNFGCTHCYLKAGKKNPEEMTSEEICRVITEFGEMGGISVDISGGEALLKEGIEDIIHTARDQRLRTVVLTNAGDIKEEILPKIVPYIDGMAVGLDGLYDANDSIRGKGTFKDIIKNLEKIHSHDIELSFTTLITPESITQLLEFPKFIEYYGGKNWSLVMPRPSGRFSEKRDIIDESYRLWDKYKAEGLLKNLHEETKNRGISVVLDHILVPGSKRRIEETSVDFIYDFYNKGRACWDNTLTVMPNGDVKCCLFFDDQIYDNVKHKSLREVYLSEKRMNALNKFKKFPIDQCPFLEYDKLKDFSNSIK